MSGKKNIRSVKVLTHYSDGLVYTFTEKDYKSVPAIKTIFDTKVCCAKVDEVKHIISKIYN